MQSILKRVNAQYLVLFLFFVVSLVLSVIRVSTPAKAAQLTARSLSLSSNVNSGTATWTFTMTTGTAAGGFEFVICTTPLAGTACDGPTGLETASLAAVTASSSPAGMGLPTGGSAPACSKTDQTAPASANTVASSGNSNFCAIRTTSTATIAAGVTTVTLSNMPNPTATGTFFVRIATYTSTGAPGGAANTYTGYTDYGTVAQSVRAATNVSFKVQEILQVCAGATTVDTNAAFGNGNTCDASGVTGYLTSVDLGVADPAAVRISPVATGGTTQGNDTDGFVLLRTNASGVTTVGYKVIQDNSSGDLKVAGVATCTLSSGRSTVSTDFCINSVDATPTAAAGSTVTAGVEHFGMTIPFVNRTGSTTTALTPAANYFSDGLAAGTCTINGGQDNNCWTWQYDGTAATLGTTSGPTDDELLLLRFAGTPALTTPTGLFQVNMSIYAVSIY